MEKRKPLRLGNWNYSDGGVYYLTMNVAKRACVFGRVEHGTMAHSQWGQIAIKYIEKIPQIYENVYLDGYMVMPNHIHLLLRLDRYGVGGASYAPRQGCDELFNTPCQSRDKQTVPKIIQATKSAITKAIRIQGERSAYDALLTKKLWQPSYYDRVLRNDTEYREIWEYIQTNPLRWDLKYNNPT